MNGLHDPGELSAHALGLLGGAKARAVEQHLAGCPACRREWSEMRETAAVLDEVPPEMFLDGPPDGDLVLQRTLQQVRAERGAARRRRRLGLVAAAVLAVAALLGAGTFVGRVSAPEPAAIAAPAGTRTVEGTNGAVAMSATLTPAAGWVRLAATVRGIAAGQECTLVVVGRDGSENVAGSWLVSPRGEVEGTTLNGSAIVAPDGVRAVSVRNAGGTEFITLRI